MVKGPVRLKIDDTNQFGQYISLVPLSDCIEGVDLKGFKYPLANACIHFGQTIGISNERVEREAEIYIKSGVALVIFSNDC
jgi:thiamine pyrophosphokinase